MSLLPQLLDDPQSIFVLLLKCIVTQTLILMGKMPPAVTVSSYIQTAALTVAVRLVGLHVGSSTYPKG